MKYSVNGKQFDLEQNRFIDDNRSQKIEPLVSSVLKVLIENCGRVVTRDQLIEDVWMGREVNESSINRNISILRKILGNTPEGEKCIKTVPKKGYMLLESVCDSSQSELHHGPNDEDLDGAPVSADSNIHSDNDSSLKEGSPNIFHYRTFKQWLLVASFVGLTVGTSAVLMTNYVFNGKKKMASNSYSTEIEMAIRHKEPNKAFCLDGRDDYIEVAKEQSLQVREGDFSVSAWIKTDSEDLITIVDQRDEKKMEFARGFSLFLYKGSIGFQMADREGSWHCEHQNSSSSCSNWIVESKIANNQWHHITITVDRDNEQGLSYYLNGKTIGEKNPTFRNGSLETENPLRVGSRSSSETTLFPGAIGEVKLYNYILPKEMIAYEFGAGLSRDCD